MLLDAPAYEFECEERRDDSDELGVEVKGKGRQYTYWVNSAKKLLASSKSNGIAKSQWTFSKRSGYEEESPKLSEGNANQACLRIGEETTREGNLLPRTFQEALPLQSKSGIAEIRAIVVTDVKPPFAVVGVNKPWEDLCGYKDAEAAGLPLSTLIQGPKTDLKGFQQAMGDLISGADCVECYTVHYRKDGSMFSNFLQMGPLYDKNDGGDVEKGDRKASYFVGVFNNVGELDRSAQEEDREENSTLVAS
jgi:PAS domain-containing protein